jgi:hypothetical protein
VVLSVSVKLLPVPLVKPLSPLIEYCQVAPTSTNLNGNADEGITYSIKGVNADKFSITANTGILTYKTLVLTLGRLALIV